VLRTSRHFRPAPRPTNILRQESCAVEPTMKIERNREARVWVLKSGGHVLYSGRRSPWERPELMREALRRERDLQGGEPRGAGA
jgi:hypothetical protein